MRKCSSFYCEDRALQVLDCSSKASAQVVRELAAQRIQLLQCLDLFFHALCAYFGHIDRQLPQKVFSPPKHPVADLAVHLRELFDFKTFQYTAVMADAAGAMLVAVFLHALQQVQAGTSTPLVISCTRHWLYNGYMGLGFNTKSCAVNADGGVVTWGDERFGGNSSSVASQLDSNVQTIYSTGGAFAAVKADGSVVTWGDSRYGGDSSSVASQLNAGVKTISSTYFAFAAIKADGNVVAWGGPGSSSVAIQLNWTGVQTISSTERAIAAVKADGSVVTWGDHGYGGGASSVADQLNSDVQTIYSTDRAFAAVKADGSVVTWGDSSYGGDSSSVASQLNAGVQTVSSTAVAFAAVKADGSVVTWGDSNGGDSSSVASQLDSNVQTIYSTVGAFAAVKVDGSVVTWGESTFGGDSRVVAAQLNSNVQTICSTAGAFAAVKADGSVVTWGDSSYGGDSSSVASQLTHGVETISSATYFFAAVLWDGSFVAWGYSEGLEDFVVGPTITSTSTISSATGTSSTFSSSTSCSSTSSSTTSTTSSSSSSSTSTTRTADSQELSGSFLVDLPEANSAQLQAAAKAALLQTVQGIRDAAVEIAVQVEARRLQTSRRWRVDFTIVLLVQKVESALTFITDISRSAEFRSVLGNELVRAGVDIASTNAMTVSAISAATQTTLASLRAEAIIGVCIAVAVLLLCCAVIAMFSRLRYLRTERVAKFAEEQFREENPMYRWAMISARFDGGELEQKFRRVHMILKEKKCNILMVSVESGDDFGLLTMQYLNKIRETQGIILAVCTRNYGEKTASPYSSHEELVYAHDNKLQVMPLKVEDTYPPEPPCGPGHPYDKKRVAMGLIGMIFKSSVLYEDCTNKSADAISESLEKRLRSNVQQDMAEMRARELAEEQFREENPMYRWAMISARFDGGELEQKFRRVHMILKEKKCNILMVSVESGDDFGLLTMQYLNKIREMQGIILAVCTRNYGEKTASPYSSHEELVYAHDNKLQVMPLKVEDTYPPEPPCGPNHMFDHDGVARGLIGMVLKPSLEPLDCIGTGAEGIADQLEKLLRRQETLLSF